MDYKDASPQEINDAGEKAWTAFFQYRDLPLSKRAHFMRSVGEALASQADHLVRQAMVETNLPEPRLRGELTRTIFQLNSYADATERGDWLDVRIDTGLSERTPPKPDLRKMMSPLGPVVVFGASNFPFAYSTAGGDTACALAAGCPVLVKAHPAHAGTSALVADAVLAVCAKEGLPENVFGHFFGAAFEVGKQLVQHRRIKAVGFTGSFGGGKALFDLANARREPIPVFAEMGSINPIFLLPGKLSESAAELAKICASSITLGVGQFCTNPGLIVGIEGEDLNQFIRLLAEEIRIVIPGKMLHQGIAGGYRQKRGLALAQENVTTVAHAPEADDEEPSLLGVATIASAAGSTFLRNSLLHQEVFGPYSLVVRCRDKVEMLELVRSLEGQLTTTLMATPEDIRSHRELVEAAKDICGRLVFNGVPTGVEVCLGMQHGGPFPATTDARFTSVGADGIKRFTRPICFQNWPNELLPPELKNENPLGLWRTVNNQITKQPVN